MGLFTTAAIGTAAAAKAATVAAVVGTATSVGTATAGFVSAGKRKREARDAASKADKAFAEAQKIASENKFAGLSIPKEGFEQQRQAILSNIAQTVQGAQEGSQRGAAAAGSRAGATGIMLADKLRAGKEDALFRADLIERRGAAGVQKNLMDLQTGLAAGSQRQAADLSDQATQLATGSFGVLSDFGKQLISNQNPFDKSAGAPTAAVTQSQVDPNVTFNESALQAQIIRPTRPQQNFIDPTLMTPDLNPIIQPQIIQQPEIFQPFNPFGMAGIQGNTAVA
tara:strand:+ start:9406 stop:10251 length:846 start_codon:yes stop_codon:yes gene_type:complete